MIEFGVACHLGVVTGMRRSELAGLQWQTVDIDAGQILVEMTVNDVGGQVVIDNFTKTRRSRCALAPDAFVFSHSRDGSPPVRPEYPTRRMRRLRTSLGLRSADFDATRHSLRQWTKRRSMRPASTRNRSRSAEATPSI